MVEVNGEYLLSLGPGLKSSEDRTLEYLREVAVQAAKDLASGKLKRKPRNKSLVDKVS